MQFPQRNVAHAAGQVLSKRSVTFTEDLRYDNAKAQPFHYSFMTRAIIEANDGIEPIGWTMGPNTINEIPIITDRDSAWHLLNIKYSAFENISGDSYRWWDADRFPVEENFGSDLTGTIGIVAAAITGAGSNFDPEIDVGDFIVFNDDTGLRAYGEIATRTNDTTATLATAVVNTVVGSTFKKVGSVPAGGGTLTLVSGSTAVVGVGTAFAVDVSAGDFIGVMDGNQLVVVKVASVTDNTNLILEVDASTGVAATKYVVMDYAESAAPWINGTQTLNTRVPRLTYLTSYLRLTVFFPSLNDHYLYGIPQRGLSDPNKPGLIERRIIPRALQGAESGLAMLRTPCQLPFDGQLVLRIQNIHPTKTLFVNGALFGYKVRV